MKRMLALLFLSAAVLGASPQKPMAEFCSINGKGGVKCDYNGQSCVQIHPDICEDGEPYRPSCCNASPDSPDRNAEQCHCCDGGKNDQ